jgi:hypothetical protein
LAFTVVGFTVVAFIVVYAREWRSASVLLRSVLPPRVLITRRVIMRHGQ